MPLAWATCSSSCLAAADMMPGPRWTKASWWALGVAAALALLAFVLVAQPTLADPSRAPEGRHVAWAYCHVPNGSTQDMREVIASQIERFAPGFRDCILDQHTMHAMQMEVYNPNYVGGDVIGGVTDAWQLFSRPAGFFHPYATPNPRIFLCSASTPPGGGVHGMCGHHAAKLVLKRVKREK